MYTYTRRTLFALTMLRAVYTVNTLGIHIVHIACNVYTVIDEDTVHPVSALSHTHIESVACGESHTLALSTSGELYSWGSGQQGQLGHGDFHR